MSDIMTVWEVENDEGETMVLSSESEAVDYLKAEIEGITWCLGDERTYTVRAAEMERSQFEALREFEA